LTGWIELIKDLYKKDSTIKIKVLWHANNFEAISDYTWKLNKELVQLYKDGKVEALRICKENNDRIL
jgi:hypothetical protein